MTLLEETLSPELKEKLEKIRKIAEPILDKIKETFPEYTIHDIRHSDEVIKNFDLIILEDLQKNMNPYEKFFLLAAAILHDIGMVKFPDLREHDKEEIRRNHHIRSEEYIVNHWKELGFDDNHQAIIVGRICRGHREDDDKLRDKEKYDWTKVYQNDSINMPFLAMVLQIADELDLTFKRAPLEYYQDNPKLGKIGKEEWEKHLSISGIVLDPENPLRIIVSAVCENHKIHRSLEYLERKIQKKLDLLQNYVHHYHHYAKSFPLRIIFNIEAKGYEPKRDYKPISDEIEGPISRISSEMFIDQNFRDVFSSKITSLTKLLKKNRDPQEVNYLIDMLISLLKERIEKWDVPSVKFATEELFTKLYKFSENRLNELYYIFEDLFNYACSQRKRLIFSMMEVFNSIMLDSWVSNDIEKGEKAAKVMLRLGIDFLNKDLEISESCLRVIDNLAGDMFEPEILSKEILLGAAAFEKMTENSKLKIFLKQLVDWVRINDQYAWDADIKMYLRDSIWYAEWEIEKYEISEVSFKRFTQKYLLPVLEENINKEIEGYVGYLSELESEENEDIAFGVEFGAEDLANMILAYEFLRPNIAAEIKKRVVKSKNPYVIKIFKRIVQSNNLLRKIYGEQEMITTFDELIEFFENNSDMENLGVGVTTYNFTMIDFKRKLKEEEQEALKKIAQKYKLKEEFEVTDQGITFEMDRLVYLGHGRDDMRKLISFLKEVNNILEIESFSTGITFKLRKFGKKTKP
ncbi:MAG: HD domain-containing protein [Thermoproteota archaeon]